jgi:hypothetical protein
MCIWILLVSGNGSGKIMAVPSIIAFGGRGAERTKNHFSWFNSAPIFNLHLSLFAKPVDPSLHAGIFNCHIQLTLFPSSLIVSPEVVYRSLVSMFPCLRSITHKSPISGCANGWKQVNEWLNPRCISIG